MERPHRKEQDVEVPEILGMLLRKNERRIRQAVVQLQLGAIEDMIGGETLEEKGQIRAPRAVEVCREGFLTVKKVGKLLRLLSTSLFRHPQVRVNPL